MSTYVYPTSDLDSPSKLLDLLGSFWSNTYQGMQLVEDILAARAQLDAQVHLDLLDLVASISRFNVPLYHRENWGLLTFLESDVNNMERVLVEYQDETTHRYDNDTSLQYGVPDVMQCYAVPCPDNLHDCRVILNRISDPSLVLIRGIDFWQPETGVLAFRENPFDNELVPVQQLFEGGVVTDRQAALWLFHGEFDWGLMYEQFGYAIKLWMQSSQGYKDLVNAVLDALVHGTTSNELHRAWSAITGVPMALSAGEIVETVDSDSRKLYVITDRHVYGFPLGSTPVVAVGDEVNEGDALVDTLMFFEFNRGQTPTASQLSGLAAGPGLLAAGYLGDLMFENKSVPLIVETVDGKTKVSFELGGFPGDVEAFWDSVHAAGVASGTTLANLLDTRANPVDEPMAASLPPTINPLEFLCQNILRHHGFVVRVRASKLSDDRLGMWTADQLRRIVPPETLMIVVVELECADEPIIMEGPGDETSPGYAETVSGFPYMTVVESLDGSTITETIRCYQIRGKCE